MWQNEKSRDYHGYNRRNCQNGSRTGFFPGRNYSRALNVELRDRGIGVTAVCPGWVDTELLPREINGKKVKYPGMVSAKSVVTKALRDAEKRRDMSVCSLYVKCQHVIVKLLPQRLVMRIWMQSIGQYV